MKTELHLDITKDCGVSQFLSTVLSTASALAMTIRVCYPDCQFRDHRTRWTMCYPMKLIVIFLSRSSHAHAEVNGQRCQGHCRSKW